MKSRADQHYLVFSVGAMTCAVSAPRVIEIIDCREVTVIHHAPSYVRGVINLRGDIVTVIDLAVKLGLDPIETERILIVAYRGERIGLSVGEIEDIFAAGADQVAPPPGHLAELEAGIVRGVFTHADQLAAILDLDAVSGKEGAAAPMRPKATP